MPTLPLTGILFALLWAISNPLARRLEGNIGNVIRA
jgi:hypothetical protein